MRFNKYLAAGNMTRDPESRTFANGGSVVSFCIAINNSRKNASTGQWEDDPCFMDCKAFNGQGNFKLADHIMEKCAKGQPVFIEGKLKQEKWTDKNTNQQRSKIVCIVDTIQILPRSNSGGQAQAQEPRESAPASHNGSSAPTYESPDEFQNYQPRGEEEIPF